MKNKTISIVASIMLMAMSMSIAVAQGNVDISVVAGDTTISDMSHSDVAASITLGALVSEISSIYERYVDFGGLKVWKDSTITTEQDWSMYAFPANTDPDFNLVTVGAVCEVSEQVDIRGVDATWTTCDAEYAGNGGDSQTPALLSEVITLDDATTIAVTDYAFPSSFSYDFDDGVTPGSTGGVAATAIDDTIAQSLGWNDAAELIAALTTVFGFDVSTDWPRAGAVSELGGTPVIMVRDGSLVTHAIADLNGDGVISFTELIAGYTADSNAGQALMILDADVYDIYGIIV